MRGREGEKRGRGEWHNIKISVKWYNGEVTP